MKRRLTFAAATVAALLVLVASFSRHPAAATVFVLCAAAFPPLLMAVGAARGGRLRSIAFPVCALFVLLAASLLGMLVLAGGVEETPRVLGLPLALAILLGGIFLAPLGVVALGFAATFDHFGVGPDELRRLRELAPADEDGERDGGNADGGGDVDSR